MCANLCLLAGIPAIADRMSKVLEFTTVAGSYGRISILSEASAACRHTAGFELEFPSEYQMYRCIKCGSRIDAESVRLIKEAGDHT